MSRVFTAAALALTVVAVVSLWFFVGNDDVGLACGHLYVYRSPALTGFTIGAVNPLASWPSRLASLVGLPRVSAGYVELPLWPIVVGCAVGAVVTRKRRRRAGLCACGYSLQGNTSGRCPECGKISCLTADPPKA